MISPQLPPDFQRLRVSSLHLWVNDRYYNALHKAGAHKISFWNQWWRELGPKRGQNAIWTFDLPTTTPIRLALRPYLHGGLLGRFRREAFRGIKRPLHELAVGTELARRGVRTPEIVLLAAQPIGGRDWRSIIGTRFIKDSQNLRQYLDTKPAPEAMQPILQATARAIRKFHDAGASHPDLHLGNLLVHQPTSSGNEVQQLDEDDQLIDQPSTDKNQEASIWILDLDQVRIGKAPKPARRMHELMRLLRSVHKQGLTDFISAEDCNYFFKTYVGQDEQLGQAMLRFVRFENLRMRLHGIKNPGIPPAVQARANPENHAPDSPAE